MNVIIIGAGKVGFSMAQLLSDEGNDVVVIEQSQERQQLLEDTLDVKVIYGSGSSTSVLESAGVRNANMLIAVTEFDELNMIACLLAKKYGVRTTVARVRNPEYLEVKGFSLNETLGVDLFINPERVTAKEIYKIIKNPESLSVEYYAKGKVQLIELEIGEDSPIKGKRLRELQIPVPFNIVAIVREHRTLVPGGDDIFQLHDRINIVARTAEMLEVEKALSFRTRRIERVTILGGGRTGCYLAQMLEASHPVIDIKIIEKDLLRARQVAEKLKNTLVIHGDGGDYEVLEEENIGRSDMFVAVTDDDKVNLLCCLIVQNLGVKKTVCQMKRTDVMPLVEQIGIDAVVSPRLITAGAILKYIRSGDIISVTLVGEERAEMLELLVQSGAAAIGKKLRDIDIPNNAVVGAVMRDDRVIIPDGNFAINAYDRLMIFALPKCIHKIEKLFLNRGR
ncbi:MAG TPA: Trk system potassium transporter TrkA [Syntrophomonas sp.]|nr:Trk system potassium transporter TrkA [Syntrophomonas sp.]